VDEVRELGRVTDEENGCVVKHPVEVALLSLELNGKSTRIAGSVSGTALSTDRGEANGSTGLVTDLVEKGGASEVWDIVGDLEVTVGTGTFCMDDLARKESKVSSKSAVWCVKETDKKPKRNTYSLRNPLTVEVSEEVDVMKILEEQRAVDMDTLSRIWFRYWGTARCLDIKGSSGTISSIVYEDGIRSQLTVYTAPSFLLKTSEAGMLYFLII